jgi:hypothetical protein
MVFFALSDTCESNKTKIKRSNKFLYKYNFYNEVKEILDDNMSM